MAGRGLARGGVDVRRGGTPSSGSFDARVAGGAAVEGGARRRSGRGKAGIRSEEEKNVRCRAEAGGGWSILGTMVAGRVAEGRR